MNTHIQELIIVAVVVDVVGLHVFPQYLLQIVFKVGSTSDTRMGIAEFRDKEICPHLQLGMNEIFQGLWIFLVL